MQHASLLPSADFVRLFPSTNASTVKLARKEIGHTILNFVPHPLLSPILPLWGDTRRLRTRSLRPLLQATGRASAKTDHTRRRARAQAQHQEIASALQKLTWKEIHRLPHSSSRQRLLLHQIKGLQLSGYATADTNDSPDFLHAVFTLDLPSAPPAVWKTPALTSLAKNDYRAVTEVFPTCQAMWQQHVLATWSIIVRWRRGMAEPARAWSRQPKPTSTTGPPSAVRFDNYYTRSLMPSPRGTPALASSPTCSRLHPIRRPLQPASNGRPSARTSCSSMEVRAGTQALEVRGRSSSPLTHTHPSSGAHR